MLNKSRELNEALSLVLKPNNNAKEIMNILQLGRSLSTEEKMKISNFVSTHKFDHQNPNEITTKIELLVEDLQWIFNDFNRKMKEVRSKEINDLKRKMNT